jgi:hypothetical protein
MYALRVTVPEWQAELAANGILQISPSLVVVPPFGKFAACDAGHAA